MYLLSPRLCFVLNRDLFIYTERSNAVVLLWFSVACFWCQSFGDVVNIIFSLVWVAERPPFGKEMLTRLTICSLCILIICKFKLFPVLVVWF